MLNINNITVQYGNNKPILENLSLEMKQGEIVSIVGESGSGKTTVIRSVMGLLPAGGKVTKGDIIFNEINTLPGFTDISMYPMLWRHDGIPTTELMDILVELALEEHSDWIY